MAKVSMNVVPRTTLVADLAQFAGPSQRMRAPQRRSFLEAPSESKGNMRILRTWMLPLLAPRTRLLLCAGLSSCGGARAHQHVMRRGRDDRKCQKPDTRRWRKMPSDASRAMLAERWRLHAAAEGRPT
jgi:hypothetical protein